MMPAVGAPLLPNPFAEFEAELVAASSAMFRVHGIRRCGQHAVINWILRNSGAADTVFLNSCTLRRSAVKTCGQSEINGVQSGKAWSLKKKLDVLLSDAPPPAVLISYEAGFPDALYRAQQISQDIPNTVFAREVLVTRSFVNWLPSFIRLMRLMNRGEKPESALISYGIAYEISRYKDHLQAAQMRDGQDEFVIVSYDNWVMDADYRRGKLVELALDEVDNSLGEVQIYGAGSSFDAKGVAASDLDISNRWRSMVDDDYAQIFIRIALADQELLEVLSVAYPTNIQIMRDLLT